MTYFSQFKYSKKKPYKIYLSKIDKIIRNLFINYNINYIKI